MGKKAVYFLCALTILLIMIYGLSSFMTQPIPQHPFFRRKGPEVIAHRGGRGLWPENTLYAYEHAADLGVDMLEMDLRCTKDGSLILLHDKSVDRTTDGSGPVKDFTLADLKQLDAGYRWTKDKGQSFPFRGKGITIPTLEEVFTTLPDMRITIEIKPSQLFLVTPLCQTIRKHHKSDQVLVASFETSILKKFRNTCAEVATSAAEREARLFYGLNLIGLGSVFRSRAQALQVPEYFGKIDVVNQRFLRGAHARNMQVHVWTVNGVVPMRRLLDLGVDGIITDYPDRALKILGR